MLKILHDIRMGGELQYVATHSNRLMRVPDAFKDSVLFATYKNYQDESVFAGTAFYFTLDTSDDYSFSYIITAKHVIDGIQQYGSGEKVYLRVNTREGGHAFIVSDAVDWYFDADPTIDVAVLPIPNADDLRELSLKAITSKVAVNDNMIRMEGIGIGEDVFIIGLFVNHYGKERNIPIMRVGNIAAMPEEKVATRSGDMVAYLVEVRSIGRISGSPVFSSLGPVRTNYLGQYFGYRFNFLGLVHGHWDLEYTQNDAYAPAIGADERINKGIAIVVPAAKIMQVLDHPELIKMREKAKQKQQDETLPTMDSNVEPTVVITHDNPFTKEGFEEALRRASRKTSSSDEEKGDD